MGLAAEGVCILPAGEKSVNERVLRVDGPSGENGACDAGEIETLDAPWLKRAVDALEAL